jgi:enoyl-CoA hydratase
MSYRDIEVERIGQIMVVRHNRAEQLNARTSQMYVEVMAAFNEASEDSNVAAVVLTGKGRLFSAGMDFKNEPENAAE